MTAELLLMFWVGVACSIWIAAVGVGCWRAFVLSRCRHPSTVRYWYRRQMWQRVCKRCGRRIAQGRDPHHRYPKKIDAEGHAA